MAWTNFPPTAGTNIQSYDYITQLWEAVREREWALGTERWPQHYFQWDTGTIDSITNNGDGTLTITDSDKDWMVQVGGTGPEVKRWVSYSDPDLPYIPANYDLIIEVEGPDNHAKIIHVAINDNDEDTLTVRSWVDWVTAGYLSSIDEADGATYFIIKRGGWWHNERWPVPPNDREHAAGNCTGDTVEIDDTTYSRITDSDVGTVVGKLQWADNLFAGKDLLVYANDGFLKRVTIVGNSNNTIWFAEQSWTGNGDYCVVNAGGEAFPGRERFGIFQFYGGYTKGVYTHQPDDSLGTAQIYADNVLYAEAGSIEVECEETLHPTGDIDAWSDTQNFCSPHEFNYSRWIWATLRGLQVWIQNNCSSFVPMDSYDNTDYIPNFTFPELMERINVNAGTATVQGPDGSNNYYISVPSTYEGETVYWSLRSAAGGVLENSSGTVTDNKIIVGTDPADSEYDGMTVYYTAGWSRWMPRMVQYMFYPEGACFVPDVDSETDTAIDPPTIDEDGFGAGEWINHPDISTTYMSYGKYGPVDTGIDFVTGELARYIGDNYADGTTGDDELHGDTPYWEHFYVGQRSKTLGHQTVWTASMSGTVTGGGKFFITDNSKTWWNENWYHQPAVEPARPSSSTVRIDTGTATSGDTGTLFDTTKIDDPSNEPECIWWRASRFVSFDTPWKDFILEVDKVNSSGDITVTLNQSNVADISWDAVVGATEYIVQRKEGAGEWEELDRVETTNYEDEDRSYNIVTSYRIIPIVNEVEEDALDVATANTWKVPIVSGSSSLGRLTFAGVEGFSVDAGDTYRIREPAYHLNQWKGRQLIITAPDGTETEVTITHSDNNTLYFASQATAIEAGSTFSIIEHQTGGVWKWDGSEWIVPTGADPRGATFLSDQRNNLPTKAKEYGFMCRGDYITIDLLTEMHDALNELQWTQTSHSWTSRADDAVAENNNYSAESMGLRTGSSIQDALDNALANAYAPGNWNATSESNGQPPFIGISADGDDAPTRPASDPAAAHVLVGGRYAYGKVTGVDTVIPCSIDWYAFATYNTTDTNESESCIVRPAPPAPTGLPDINTSIKFNDGGTGLHFRKWSLHDTTGLSSDATRKSAKLDVDNPPQGNHNFSKVCASADGFLYTMNQGFYVSQAKCILKWDLDYV